MQEKGIISTNQFIWMVFIIITSLTATHMPRMMIIQAERDAWLAVIGGWFLDVLLALVYAYMGIRFPGQNFVQYSVTILGKIAGKIVGIMFPLFFLMVCAFLQYGLSQVMTTLFFKTTPFEVILIVSYILIGYAARKGIEVIARVSEILGPIFIISLIILYLLVIPYTNIERLKPQLDQGFYPFLTGSPLALTFFGICIMMAMFIPHCNRPKNGFLAKFTAVSLGAFIIVILVSASIAAFGLEPAEKMIYPNFELMRVITIRGFFARMEIIWMMVVIGAGIMASAQMIWAFSLGISQIVGLNSYKPLVYPAVLLSLMLSLTSFDRNVEHMNFVHYAYPIIAIFVEAGLEILLFVAALVLNKRGKLN